MTAEEAANLSYAEVNVIQESDRDSQVNNGEKGQCYGEGFSFSQN